MKFSLNIRKEMTYKTSIASALSRQAAHKTPCMGLLVSVHPANINTKKTSQYQRKNIIYNGSQAIWSLIQSFMAWQD